MKEGRSSATDFVTDLTDVRNREEGIGKKEEVKVIFKVRSAHPTF